MHRWFARTNPETNMPLSLISAARIADWFAHKYRTQAAQVGMQQAARNLRKQGVPLHVARMILLGVE